MTNALAAHLRPFTLFSVNCLLGLLLLGCSNLPQPSPQFTGPTTIAELDDTALNEISGIVTSRVTPGLFWMNNDSGDSARIFAVDQAGVRRGTVTVGNATARDWEELAAFTHNGQSWLVLADCGDNYAVRTDLVLYFIREPAASALSPDHDLNVNAEIIVPFSFEDGPRDCEGIAVTPAGDILLISKRTEPPVLYHLPVKVGALVSGQPLVAAKVTPLPGILPPSAVERALPGRLGQFRSWVTAFDVSPDDHTAAVLTYGNIWIYHRTGKMTWTDALAGTPDRIQVSGLQQAEAVCFSLDSHDLFITSEGENAPIMRYRTATK